MMKSQKEKTAQPNYYLTKDKVGELLEDTVHIVLEGLQPVSLIRRIGELVNTGLSLFDVFQDLPRIVLEELPVNRVALIKETSNQKLEIIAARDRWREGPPKERGWRPQDRIDLRGRGKSPMARAWKARKIWVEDLSPDAHGNPQRFVGVPFQILEEKRGILCFVAPGKKPLESYHLALWSLLSSQISLVLSAASRLQGQKLWNHLLEDRVRERTNALHESESKYRTLVENLSDTLFTTDKEGRFSYVSPQAERLTGYPLKRLLNMTFRELVEPEDLSLMERQAARMATGEETGPFEISIRNAGGSRVHLEVNASAVRNENHEIIGIQGIARDITEREQLKRQLQHAQKMEAVGTLAGGMAHEFNNILAAIQGYAQLLAMHVEADDPLAEYVSNIDISCQRAANLTRKILTFSRLEGGSEMPVKLNRVVNEVQQLLRQTLPPQIQLESALDPQLPFVLADPAQLEQVLLNLGVNARDGMPDGGTIRFETHQVDLDEAFCRIHPWAQPGRCVELLVKDNGRGMPPEVLERAFDPFFTTKEPGKGTGLGLSIAYSIVKNHNGYIIAESQVDRGSCFRVYLPVYEKFKEEDAELPEKKSLLRGEGESVLVVDDEPQFRDVVQNMLECSGYRVTPAIHGDEALSLYAHSMGAGEGYDLVILDIAMPVMDGEAYLERLLKIDPDANVLIATGYGEDDLRSEAIKQKCKGILFKPFDLSTLLLEVRNILDG